MIKKKRLRRGWRGGERRGDQVEMIEMHVLVLITVHLIAKVFLACDNMYYMYIYILFYVHVMVFVGITYKGGPILVGLHVSFQKLAGGSNFFWGGGATKI